MANNEHIICIEVISKLEYYLLHLLYNLFVLIELIWFKNFVPSIKLK